MKHFFEKLTALFWNRFVGRKRLAAFVRGLILGSRVVDETLTSARVVIPQARRVMHIALLGKTGTGKSSLLRRFCEQDIEAGRGFAFFDLHGDAVPMLLAIIAGQERKSNVDLSEKVIVVDPTDPEFSVGLNPLEVQSGQESFVTVLQFAEVLKQRWSLHTFGARTDELLRNSLIVLAENQLTLLELAPLLTDDAFRASCMKRVTNAEIRQYFELRYDAVSDAMRAVLREPILNKTSAFTSDPHFRHIVGQTHSTFSLREAMDEGHCVVANLPKGRLGEQALTLASLLFTMLKNTLFTREKRSLYTVYCDEIQNLASSA